MLGEQYIGALDIPMEDVHLMQDLKSVQHLDGHPPDIVLIDMFLPLLVALDEPAQIPAIGELGDQEQAAGSLIIDGFFIADDVGVGNAGEYPNLVEAIGDFSEIAVRDLDFLHGVD